MQSIPFFHSYNPVTKQLTLRGATYFPEEVFQFANEIEILDAAGGTLTNLPDDFYRLHQLKVLFLSQNQFEEVPAVLAACPNLTMVGLKSCRIRRLPEQALPVQLRWLVLTHNQLTTLPQSMGELTQLQKLSLAGNRLSSLPESMQACRALELMRLAANNFGQAPPDWVWQLPRLAWYGDAGNPFCPVPTLPPVPTIAWDELTIGDVIGESPSSRVYRAHVDSTRSELAVKVYKGEMTSDGNQTDDLNMTVAAGKHPNLIPLLGKLAPQAGLVFDLVPPSYTRLGLPPSLQSCTRDTYPFDAVFSLPFIIQVLIGIARACQYVHNRGLMHGDLYAHNILANDVGQALLGDFGAASYYSSESQQQRERIDVRAFGYLIDDLLTRCASTDSATLKKLFDVRQICLQERPAARPLFSEIQLG